MKILAIDYGTKRIGLALVSTELSVVIPFGVLKNENSGVVKNTLAKLVKDEDIKKIIVGLPIGLRQEKETEHVLHIRAFATELESAVGFPVELFDERFSSQQADRMGPGASRDEKSAMVILEGYLETLKRKNMRL